MTLMLRRCSLVAVAALVLTGAMSCRGGETFDIPDSYRTSGETYTLLYSTVGYELAGPKRLLIRQNDAGADVSEGLSFGWRVVDDRGNVELDGRAAYSGTGWGIPVWTVDFGALDEPGRYRITVEAPGVQLATEEFAVDDFLLFRSTFEAVAIDNAIAREAPIELDNGFFDSNGTTGSTPAHADWLVGLVEVYERRRNVISDEQRRQLRASIDRAIDYLLRLSDPATGEFAPGSPTRGAGIFGAHNTASGVRALARYAAAFHREDPTKAERAHRRAILADEWLTANEPDAYPSWLRASVNYDLYRYVLIDAYLEKAAQAVRDQIATYDLRTMERPSDDTVPHVEAMYRMWRDLPSHPDHGFWGEAATAIAAQYKQMLSMNPFDVIPPGVTNQDFGTSPVEQWDEAATAPHPGAGDHGLIANTWFMSRAIDAAYLSDMTGDPALATMAAAGVGWVTGLNPGVASDRVAGSAEASPVEAASFLTGLPVRTADTWSVWEWLRPRRHGTIVNGFQPGFSYDDGFATGETSLASDGLWLYAMTAFEDVLQPSRRAPAPDAKRPYATAIHVESADASRTGSTLQFVVRVVDQAGARVPGVRVIVLWEGSPTPEALLEDARATGECVTGSDGSCLATVAQADIAAAGPITASVSNLEHRAYAYDIDADDHSKSQVIP